MTPFEIAALFTILLLLQVFWHFSYTTRLKRILGRETIYIERLQDQIVDLGALPVERPAGEWQIPK